MSDEIVHVTASQQGIMPKSLEAAMNLANLMASAKLVPLHLQKSPGDCLLVINQACRWGLDPMTVAQSTCVVSGKLCYEGKLVAAVLVSTGAIKGRPDYEFSGEGDNRTIKISAMTNDGKVRTLIGTVKDWKSNNRYWQSQPDDMLIYRGIRQWARRYAPEAMLGILTPDEMLDEEKAQRKASEPPPVAGKKAVVAEVTPVVPVPHVEPPEDPVIDAEEIGPDNTDEEIMCLRAIQEAASILELENLKETMRSTWGSDVPEVLKREWANRKKALRAV